jgi:DNA-binding PadR family transcriptional regulator
MTDPSFPGWQQPKENWSKLPHSFMNIMKDMKLAELKVTLYLLRHTWGFGNFDEFQLITLDEFQYGRHTKRGTRQDGGTGLSKPSIIAGLREAEERGTIESTIDTKDKARIKKGYKLRGKDSLQQSKNLTPEVKIFDIDLNKETLKERKDQPSPSEKKESKQEDRNSFNSEMEKRFSMASGIPLPQRKNEAGRRAAGRMWNNPLWSIYDLFRPDDERAGIVKRVYSTNSLTLALSLIQEAVEHMRESNLTMSTPASILNVATSIYAEKYAGTYDPEQSADFWKEYV